MCIVSSVTSIGHYAFGWCTSLTSVTIGNGVTSIESHAFYGCTSLIYNEYDNAYYLGNETNPYVVLFEAKDTSITSCTINENTKCIYSYAFEDCTSLTSVTIPDSVTSIGHYAFQNCTSLANINVDENNTVYKSIDGNLYSKDRTTLIQYAIGKTDTSFVIPSSVTSIGAAAFRYCTSLTSITISNSVTSIGDSAFADCTSLESVTIGDSVTSIGNSAFAYCSKLTSVTFENTSGWWYASVANATSGTSISSSDLANASTAATYLTSTYNNYVWKRS